MTMSFTNCITFHAEVVHYISLVYGMVMITIYALANLQNCTCSIKSLSILILYVLSSCNTCLMHLCMTLSRSVKGLHFSGFNFIFVASLCFIGPRETGNDTTKDENIKITYFPRHIRTSNMLFKVQVQPTDENQGIYYVVHK